MPRKVLILAGTNEARILANLLVNLGHEVISSFAGVTEHPTLPEGQIRIGGFGGVQGLQKFLANENIEIFVDATHPFAAVISSNAAEASPQVLRLERPIWQALPKDNWIHAPDNAAALNALPANARVLLTIGRKEVSVFTARPDLSGVARMIEPPTIQLSQNWKLILERPPFKLADELALMTEHGITHLVTKNAGGREAAAKLEAARNLALPVIMITRPFKPAVETFSTIEAIAAAIASR